MRDKPTLNVHISRLELNWLRLADLTGKSPTSIALCTFMYFRIQFHVLGNFRSLRYVALHCIIHCVALRYRAFYLLRCIALRCIDSFYSGKFVF
jgi:hypothetical protein